MWSNVKNKNKTKFKKGKNYAQCTDEKFQHAFRINGDRQRDEQRKVLLKHKIDYFIIIFNIFYRL